MLNIDIRFKPSKQFILFILLLVLGSAGIILSLQLVWWIKGILLIISLTYGFYIFRNKVLLLDSHSIQGIRQDGEGIWYLMTNQNAWIGELTGDSAVTTWVSVLLFKIQGKKLKRSVVVFHDSMEAADYRRLLVCLKSHRF